MRPKRLPGITVLSLLFFLNMAFYVGLAVLAVADRGALGSVLAALSPSGTGPERAHLAMGRLLPVYYLVSAVATAALGMGFWRLWNGARLAVLALLGLSVLGLIAEAQSLLRTPTAGAIALTLFRVGLTAFIAWYLTCRPVRSAFGARSRPPGVGATSAGAGPGIPP